MRRLLRQIFSTKYQNNKTDIRYHKLLGRILIDPFILISPPEEITTVPMTTEFDEDIAEAEKLLAQATRPRVQRMIQGLIHDLKLQKETTPVQTASAPIKVTKSYIDAFTCGFDQEGDNVLLFWELPEVGTVPKDHVNATFNADSVVITVEGLKGKNHRLSIGPLFQDIKPEECKYKVGKNRITVTLTPVNRGTHWQNLKRAEDRFAKSLKKDKVDTDDPGKGLMDLMRNMYENGDDEMKRTIAKAWTESREQQARGQMPGMGGMGGMVSNF